jgi:hypothetical protein
MSNPNARLVSGNAKGAPWLRRPSGAGVETREQRLARLMRVAKVARPITRDIAKCPGDNQPLCLSCRRFIMTAAPMQTWTPFRTAGTGSAVTCVGYILASGTGCTFEAAGGRG